MEWLGQYETLVQQIAVFMIGAASLQFALRAGVFSLVAAGTWMLGAYGAALTLREGGSTLLAVALAVLIGSVASSVMSLLTQRISGLTLAMATLAFDLIVVVAISGWTFAGGPLGLYGIPSNVTTLGVIVMALAVAISLAMTERGRLGRALDAMREDPLAAGSVGLPVMPLRHVVTVISGALGALSGALYALMFSVVTPDQGGFDLVILLLSMVVIGGIDSWRGAYLGAALLLYLPEVSRSLGSYQEAFYGVLVILVVVWAPSGLFGVFQALFKRGRASVSHR